MGGGAKRKRGAAAAAAPHAPTSGGGFTEGDKALVLQGGVLHAARVGRCEAREGGEAFVNVHFLGWGDRWDEWVRATDARPFDAALVGTRVEDPPTNAKAPTGGKRWGGGAKPAALELSLPAALRARVLDEWDAREDPPLSAVPPATVTVGAALGRWRAAEEEAAGAGAPAARAAAATASGLREYFVAALLPALLYEREREAYTRALGSAGAPTPAELCGTHLLLRLLVKLPEMLPAEEISPDARTALQDQLARLVRFIAKHEGELFAASPAAPS